VLVRDYMLPDAPQLKPLDTVQDAARLFRRYKVGAAPVVGMDGALCGIVTATDVVGAVAAGLPSGWPIGEIMTRNVVSVREDCPLAEARKMPFDCLPVLDAAGVVVGMITGREFFGAWSTQLQRAQDEVRALIGSAHDGIVVVDTHGVVTAYNEAAAALIGMPAAEALGRPINEVIPNSGLRKVLETGTAERDCQLLHGGRTILSNRSPILEGRKVVGALAILQDTSELHGAVTQLLDAQHNVEDLTAVFESARYGIIIVNENGVIARVNKSYENTFNVVRDEVVGRPVSEVIENTRLDVVARTGIPELGEIQLVNGRQTIVNRIPVFKNGKLAGAIGEVLFGDISEVNYLLQRLQHLEQQVSRYRSELDELRGDSQVAIHSFDSIVGSSRIVSKTKHAALRAAQTEGNVLLLGESGTGKELFAHAIHKASKRQGAPFITVNCAALPYDLLESELFGYEEGAFTGAKRGGKKGKFELADKGTLFLDEIGDMPLAMQAKILRVLDDGKVDRIGGLKAIACDVRIIAATNKPLALMVQQQTFREDLYYRLNVFRIHIPPLRERREDIGELVHALTPEISRAAGRPAMDFAPETMALLREYSWPGNVRQLINLLRQLAAAVDSPLILPRHLLNTDASVALTREGSPGMDSERDRIAEALAISKGNKALAARLSGLHRSTLYEKMKKYGL
jgi:PAS domain S-box-containing protein